MQVQENNKNIKILIIDDEKMIRQTISYILSKSGHRLIEADKGKEGIEICKSMVPDLVLLDLNMPDMSGFEILEFFKTNIPQRNFPVVILSGQVSKQDVAKSYELGAAGFISKKDFAVNVFIKKINFYLNLGNNQKKTEFVKQRLEPCPENFSEEIDIPKLSNSELQYRISRIKKLKAMPYVIAEITNISGNEEASAIELTKIIQKDQALLLRVLQVANSTYYKSVARVTDLRKAIMNLGMNKIREIALSCSLIDKFADSSSTYSVDRFKFWEHSLACGIFGEALARKISCPNPEIVFLAGVLHDLGKAYFDDYFHDEYINTLKVTEQMNIPLEKVEKKLFGIDHSELVMEILETQMLPLPIYNSIRYHEKSWLEIQALPDQNKMLIYIVYLANILVKILHLGDSYNPFLQETPDLLSDQLGITSDLLAQVINEGRIKFHEISQGILFREFKKKEVKEKTDSALKKVAYVISPSSKIINPLALLTSQTNFDFKVDIAYPDNWIFRPDLVVLYMTGKDDHELFRDSEIERINEIRGIKCPILCIISDKTSMQVIKHLKPDEILKLKFPLSIRDIKKALNRLSN